MNKDYFSAQAALYRRHRPHYPAELFAFLADAAAPCARVCDCATGSGQAARGIAAHTRAVIALDQSAAQLAQAGAHERVVYVQASAERMPLADTSIDLLMVAQALHWFDFPRFFDEASRVMRPGAVFAAWTYSFIDVSPQLGYELDAAVRWFYHDIIGPYWPPERRWVDCGYRGLEHPFEPLSAPPFTITLTWTVDDLLGYIASWSAVQEYRRRRGDDPMARLAARVAPLWSAARPLELNWPLGLLLGRRR